MDKIRRDRRPIRNQVKKTVAELEKLCAEEPLQRRQMKVLLQILADTQVHLVELDFKVMEQMVTEDLDEAEEDAEYDQIHEIKKNISNIRDKTEELLGSGQQPVVTLVSHSNSGNFSGLERNVALRGYRLPKLELKKFSGELRDWLSYWAQFEKIDSDPNLHGSDKFQYLLQSLQSGTDAYELASSYPQSEQNYAKVVEALKRRYGNTDLQLQVYLRELLKLVISNVNTTERMPFQMLHLKLESHLRALKTLKLTSADPETWLYPLVESSLPDEILLTWQRSPLSICDGSKDDPPRSRIDFLMEFLEKESDIQQRITLARDGFGAASKIPKDNVVKKKPHPQIPTLAGCHTADPSSCVFCGKNHATEDCRTARHWTNREKINILKEIKVCFTCFRNNHFSSQCRAKVQCSDCAGRHHFVMCPNPIVNKKKPVSGAASEKVAMALPTTPDTAENLSGMVNQTCSNAIALQTLQVTICNGKEKKQVRAFLDSGAQGSYVLQSTAQELGLEVKATEEVSHFLFGGIQTELVKHNKYNLVLAANGYSCIIGVRDQEKICNFIPRVSGQSERVKQDLRQEGITLSDVGEGCPPIEVLIGADVYGRLMTGQVRTLPSGVTAIQTKLGWTLCGKRVEAKENNLALCSLSMTVRDASVTQLWDLDLLGIQDDTAVKSKIEIDEEDKKLFFESLSRKEDGRYVIALPWKEGHPPLSINREVAYKRLLSTTKKLEEKNLFNQYSQLFQDWKRERFVEDVTEVISPSGSILHYLPHRAVLKPSSLTTPVRPVFDGSCKVGKSPSLNDCQKKGMNLIQLIPDILRHFREKRIGFTSDIQKAFQMIEVREEDRDHMRFLWWKDETKTDLIEYRHARVMFGATSSPFILGAVLEYHLTHVKPCDKEIADRLLKTLYVDNCASSEDSVEKYQNFKEKSTNLLAEAKMNLRMWMSNVDEMGDPETHKISVLGVMWDRVQDELFVDVQEIVVPDIVTKRTVLSVVQKVFDPIGFISPATIPIKLLLQRTWIEKLKWDDPLPEEEEKTFRDWITQLDSLKKIRITRCFTGGEEDRTKWSLHVFTDASKVAYGTVVFLRIEFANFVLTQFVEAKARVAPVKKVTIPRLELLGCLIGARLVTSIKRTLGWNSVSTVFWSDSTTALAWIKRDDIWGTYVGNRVNDIRELTNLNEWRHVPGTMNPADLPSRGCPPRTLLKGKWWEGPEWLKRPPGSWPCEKEEVYEELVVAERRKSVVIALHTGVCLEPRKNLSFPQIIRIFAQCGRFIYNMKNKGNRRVGALNLKELNIGEQIWIKCIQKTSFTDKDNLNTLNTETDTAGIIRVKTKIIFRDDTESFRIPAVLPGKNKQVHQLIMYLHQSYCHAGVGFLMTKLREKYWIIQARRTIKSVIGRCIRCQRMSAKSAAAVSPPLPVERVQSARVFEVVGVDLTGPLYLKNKKKVWIVIFSCAVYRAVRLELIESLSTTAFLDALKKFIRMHGRPRLMMSDNATNFHGANNLFKTLDWKVIQKMDPLEPIRWKFNIPSTPWWGGHYERLIRILKDMMKRSIGKATLSRSELQDTLWIMEEVMNGRPLSYVTETAGELEPLTPAMFMSNVGRLYFPEGCANEADKIQYRWKYITTLRKELHQRYRKDYLAQLVSRDKIKPFRPVRLDELVLVADDQKKRIMWPLGRIVELFPGKDGICRTVRVRTEKGILVKPIQRLFPLEINNEI